MHRGLVNTGAVGYVTTLLHCLYHWPGLADVLSEHVAERSSGDAAPSIAEALHMIFQQMAAPMEGDGDAVELDRLFAAFGWGSRETTQLHDIHEFALMLIDRLRSESPKIEAYFAKMTTTVEERVITAVSDDGQPGEVLSRRNDAGLGINLSASRGSWENALREVFTTDRLEGDNKYQHPTTRAMVVADMKIQLGAPLPQILMVEVKRFDLDFNTMSMKKVTDHFAYPEQVELFGTSFQLFSVITHQSPRIDHGYLSCIARSPSPIGTAFGPWLDCRDATVRPYEGSPLEYGAGGSPNSPCCVLLFYSQLLGGGE